MRIFRQEVPAGSATELVATVLGLLLLVSGGVYGGLLGFIEAFVVYAFIFVEPRDNKRQVSGSTERVQRIDPYLREFAGEKWKNSIVEMVRDADGKFVRKV